MLRTSLAALGWLGFLLLQPHNEAAAPWLCFFLVVGTASLSGFLHLRQELTKYYSLPAVTKPELHTYVSSFFLASCLLALLASIAGLWHWLPVSPSKYSRQVVDIELIATADAVERKELLPATSADLKTAKKVSSSSSSSISSSVLTGPRLGEAGSQADLTPTFKVAGKSANANRLSSPGAAQSKLAVGARSDLMPPAQPEPQSRLQPGFKTKTRVQNNFQSRSSNSLSNSFQSVARPNSQSEAKLVSRSLAQNEPVEPFVTPRGWKTITVGEALPKMRLAAASAAKPGKEKNNISISADVSPILSEVAPMDMIESIDNDGETAEHVQRLNMCGGRSSGGKGAPSELADFLKALNRRIKRHWQAPLGAARAAQVEFLINHDGTLAGFKLLESSGDRATDRSIALAIEKTFPFQALPASYKNANLMVHYAFRYNKLNGDGLVE